MTMTEYQKENERQFKIAKENINVRLPRAKKYYYANQCKAFTDYVMEHGYPYIDKAYIVKHGISFNSNYFNSYSINIGFNSSDKNLKTFGSKVEMLGFVIGFNEAKSDVLPKSCSSIEGGV